MTSPVLAVRDRGLGSRGGSCSTPAASQAWRRKGGAMYAERRTKPEARDLEWGTAVLLVALLAAVACSGSGGGSDQHQPTPPAVTTSSSPSISPTPSPTATMIGDQLVPLEE